MNEVPTNNPAFFPNGIDNAETITTTNESQGLDEAAIDAAQLDMQDRQIMEATNDERLRYSRIFRRGFKAGAKWREQQKQKLLVGFEEARDKANFEESHSLNAFISFEEGFKAGAEWMAGQGFPRWRKIDEEKPKQGEACACIIVTINGHIKYSNFEDGPWRWDSEAKYISTDNEKGCFIENGYGEEETHTCSYWMPWDEFMGALERQFKK